MLPCLVFVVFVYGFVGVHNCLVRVTGGTNSLHWLLVFRGIFFGGMRRCISHVVLKCFAASLHVCLAVGVSWHLSMLNACGSH